MQSGKGILLEFDRLSQCQRCQRGAGCGSAQFTTSTTSVYGESALRLWLRTENLERYSIGQAVVVSTQETDSGWLGLVLVSFALPLSGMILATLIATWATTASDMTIGSAELTQKSGADELAILCSAVFGLAAGIFLWTRLPNKLSNAAETSLCLQSARIETALAHCDTNEMHNE